MALLDPEQRKQLLAAGRVSTVGLELALSIALGLLGGRWLDSKLGTEPWLQWIGFALGLAAGAMSLYTVTRSMREQLEEDQDSP
ncbi:MAG: AtpZ/AtpI family protein [Myxococcales bacterium]|nr:AtpZ/AtpI family protein [Myxococcales bacterium]